MSYQIECLRCNEITQADSIVELVTHYSDGDGTYLCPNCNSNDTKIRNLKKELPPPEAVPIEEKAEPVEPKVNYAIKCHRCGKTTEVESIVDIVTTHTDIAGRHLCPQCGSSMTSVLNPATDPAPAPD